MNRDSANLYKKTAATIIGGTIILLFLSPTTYSKVTSPQASTPTVSRASQGTKESTSSSGNSLNNYQMGLCNTFNGCQCPNARNHYVAYGDECCFGTATACSTALWSH